MKHSSSSRILVIALAVVVALWGALAHRPTARAADKAPAPAAAAPVTLPSLLSGKLYPPTLKAADVDASFQMVDLVDTQGKPGTYVTQGETATAGGETFLVAYFISVGPGQPAATMVAPGSTLRLAFINMRYVQAMVNPRAAVSAP